MHLVIISTKLRCFVSCFITAATIIKQTNGLWADFRVGTIHRVLAIIAASIARKGIVNSVENTLSSVLLTDRLG